MLNTRDMDVRQAQIDGLYEDGVLSSEQAQRGGAALRASLAWGWWADRMLLLLGVVLILSGIIFFFAYNWADMRPMHKLAVVEVALVACLLLAWRRGIDHLTGRLALLSASVLVGVFLAVLGQIYQTGADAWTLFATWAALIVPWTLLARFPALWILLLALLNLSISYYYAQVGAPLGFTSTCVALAAVNGGALALREALLNTMPWLAERWVRPLLLFAALAVLEVPALMYVVEPDSVETSIVALLLYLAVMGAAWAWYRYRAPDMGALALWSLSACVAVLTAIGRVLFDGSRGDATALFLIFGLIVLAVFAAAVHWLRGVSRTLALEDANA